MSLQNQSHYLHVLNGIYQCKTDTITSVYYYAVYTKTMTCCSLLINIGHHFHYSVIADIFDSRVAISSHVLHVIQCGFNPL